MSRRALEQGGLDCGGALTRRSRTRTRSGLREGAATRAWFGPGRWCGSVPSPRAPSPAPRAPPPRIPSSRCRRCRMRFGRMCGISCGSSSINPGTRRTSRRRRGGLPGMRVAQPPRARVMPLLTRAIVFCVSLACALRSSHRCCRGLIFFHARRSQVLRF